MQAHPDTVKKGYLKYKASKLNGRSGVATQGPKTSYKLYAVFRAPSGVEKFLDFYLSDRKYLEMGPPKWTVDLSLATKLTLYNDNRVCFCLELGDGGACLLEAKTPEEADEWITCFNAVLFLKGNNGGERNLYYEVELYQSEQLEYHGPAYLELADGYLIVWTFSTQEEVVRWKLSHIRSFKAKKTVLTIFTGSRSSTGVGEFYFNSPLSVQITHAIETLVAHLKSKKSSSNQTGANPLSALTVKPPLGPRFPQASALPTSFIETEETGLILGSGLQKTIPSHSAFDGYEDPDLITRPQHRNNDPRQQRFSPPKVNRKPGGYEEIPDGPFNKEAAAVPHSKPQPPPLLRKKELTPSPETMYAQVDMVAKRKSRPLSMHLPPTLDQQTQPYRQLNHFGTVSRLLGQEYGKLAHANKPTIVTTSPTKEYSRLGRPSVVPGYQPQEYSRLELTSGTTPVNGYQPEEYSQLGQSAASAVPGYQPEEYSQLGQSAASAVPGYQPEEYSQLGQSATSAVPGYQPEEYSQLGQSVASAVPGYQPEEYSQLGQSATSAVPGYQPEEYRWLEQTTAQQFRTQKENRGHSVSPTEYSQLDRNREVSPAKNMVSPSEEYGKLNAATFDPYGTLRGDELEKAVKNGLGTRAHYRQGYEVMNDELSPDEAVYSEVDSKPTSSNRRDQTLPLPGHEKKQPLPPAGYENTVLKVSAAEKASFNSHNSLQDDNSTHSSPVPPRRSVKHKYINVDDNGMVKFPPAPAVVPRHYKAKRVTSSTPEEPHVLRKGRSLDEESSPTPVPRTRATVHANRLVKKPPITSPKPKINKPN